VADGKKGNLFKLQFGGINNNNNDLFLFTADTVIKPVTWSN
jgi:hypothetical protein